MRGPLELDDFGGTPAPLCRDFGHSPEAGEERVDRTGKVNDLLATPKLGADKTAFKPKLGGFFDVKHWLFHTRIAPHIRASASERQYRRLIQPFLDAVNRPLAASL
jgi:hypothetical protein